MDWEAIGYMVGNALSGAYFKHQHDRWVDEGRKALKDLSAVGDSDRQNAQTYMNKSIDGEDVIGKSPELMILREKRNYKQAENDRQYLLDNGYAADSKEVKEFEAKMEEAHKRAEAWRGYGKSAGIDIDHYGDGWDLQRLNHEVSRMEYPDFYAQKYDLTQNIPHSGKNLWADMGAKYALGLTNQPPTATPTAAQPTTPAAQPPPQDAAAAAAQPANTAQQSVLQQAPFTPQQGFADPKQISLMPQDTAGVAAAANLSHGDLMRMLQGAPTDDPRGIRGMLMGNAFSPGAGDTTATQGTTVGQEAQQPQQNEDAVQPVQDTQAAQGEPLQQTQNMQQGAQQGAEGSQAAQDAADATKSAEDSIGMDDAANTPQMQSEAPAGNTLLSSGLLMGDSGGIKAAPESNNAITAKSLYKYLQSVGMINGNVDYDTAIDELAKAFAEERVRRMTDDDKREYLVSHGIGNDIASIVIPEANAKARDKARQDLLAQVAGSANNPMMAQLVALAGATDGAGFKEILDAVKGATPDMAFKDTDLGGTLAQTYFDKKGFINPQSAVYAKTATPEAIVRSQDNAARRKLDADIANARNQKDLAVAMANNNTRYATAKMQQDNANWRAQYRGQGGGSGGSGGKGEKEEKLTQAQQHFLNEFSNRYLSVKQAITNGYGEDDHSLQDLTDFLYENGRKILSPDEFRKFESYVYALQGYMWKLIAVNDPTNEDAENQAEYHWKRVSPEILEEEFPGYNFDAYK